MYRLFSLRYLAADTHSLLIPLEVQAASVPPVEACSATLSLFHREPEAILVTGVRDSALEAIVLVLARRLVDWFDEWEARLVSQGCCLAQSVCSHRRWSPKDDRPEVCPGLPSFVVAGVPVRDVCGLPRGRGGLASLSSVHCFRGQPLARSWLLAWCL